MTLPTTKAGWRKLFDDTLPSERIERAIDCLLALQAAVPTVARDRVREWIDDEPMSKPPFDSIRELLAPAPTPIREEMTDELIDEHTHAMFEDAPPMETIDEMRAIARHFYALGQGKS